MAEAVISEEILKESDLANIVGELLEVQNKSDDLGLMLKLDPYVVQATHDGNPDPQTRLRRVISEFLKQVDPTWREIIEALRSDLVGFPRLAKKVEDAHIPNPTSIRDVELTEGSSTEAEAAATTSTSEPKHTNALPRSTTEDAKAIAKSAGQMTTQYLAAKIRQFEKRFNKLKKSTRESLEKRKITVTEVVDALTNLPTDEVEEHKQFLESHIDVLYQAENHYALIGKLSFNMNYLSYQLLDYLINEFELEVRQAMEAYKRDLQQFRSQTSLNLFCETQKKRFVKPPSKFKELTIKFEWPENVTLEDVERFREVYAYHYQLRECAMMLAEVRPHCFVVTWYIPEAITAKLKAKIPRGILKKYAVSRLEVAGVCVYTSRKPQVPIKVKSVPDSGSTPLTLPGPSRPGLKTIAANQIPEEDFPFVEQPSEDFFCPVTAGLLLQPHLTSCCGKHLSQEAATRIQREGKPCPLCKTSHWSTMLNKHFQRQVNELRTFCRHEDRGCGWQGERSDYSLHVQSCPMKSTPLLTDLLQLSMYREEIGTMQVNESKKTMQEDESMKLVTSGSVASSTSILSTSNVVKALKTLNVEKTRNLVFHLGVPPTALDDIEQVYSGDTRKQKYVEKWLDIDTSASWEKLVSGLREIDIHVLAAEVESEYKTMEAPPPASYTPFLAPLPLAQPISAPAQLEAAPLDLPVVASTPPALTPTPANSKAKVRASIDSFEEEFSDISVELRIELSKMEKQDCSFFERFQDHLLALPAAKKEIHVKFFTENEDDILEATKIKKLLAILNRYCNYSNYEIIFFIIKKFCGKPLQQRMLTYIDSHIEFEKNTTVDVYLCAISAPPESDIFVGFTKMALKINKPSNICTLYEIRQLIESIARNASLHSHSVYIEAHAQVE